MTADDLVMQGARASSGIALTKFSWNILTSATERPPDSKVHGANMGPTWVLSAPDGPHDGLMNLAIKGPWSLLSFKPISHSWKYTYFSNMSFSCFIQYCVMLDHVIVALHWLYLMNPQTILTKGLWADSLILQISNFLFIENYWSDQVTILYMSWQHSCHDMYKFVIWLHL